MNLLTLSLTFRTASLADLERVAIREAALGEALSRLLLGREVLEAALISTCNRTEVYAWVADPGRAEAEIRSFLEDFQGLPRGWTHPRSRILHGEEAIRHLFLVAAGLDSMVLGETQIQGQVKEAYRAAAELGSLGPNLHAIFRWALEAGKKARAATGLARARRSLSRAGVEALLHHLGRADGKEVLVVGAGKMAGLSMEVLLREGARVRVAVRRPEAARPRAGAEVISIGEMDAALVRADAAIFATASLHLVLTRERLVKVMRERGGRALVLVDLGMPRNVDPGAAELKGVELYDLERLERDGFTGPGGWEEELERARAIALAEAEECLEWLRSRAADRVVRRIQDLAAEVAEAEAERVLRKLPGAGPSEREAVAAAIRRAVRKLVHLPTVRAKEAAARGDDSLLEAAAWLFGLSSEERAGEGERSTEPEETGGAG